MPDRGDIASAMRDMRYHGIAYPDATRWDGKGDNFAAITALNVVRDGDFVQVAEIAKDEAASIA